MFGSGSATLTVNEILEPYFLFDWIGMKFDIGLDHVYFLF
jgi:hypothetical protein